MIARLVKRVHHCDRDAFTGRERRQRARNAGLAVDLDRELTGCRGIETEVLHIDREFDRYARRRQTIDAPDRDDREVVGVARTDTRGVQVFVLRIEGCNRLQQLAAWLVVVADPVDRPEVTDEVVVVTTGLLHRRRAGAGIVEDAAKVCRAVAYPHLRQHCPDPAFEIFANSLRPQVRLRWSARPQDRQQVPTARVGEGCHELSDLVLRLVPERNTASPVAHRGGVVEHDDVVRDRRNETTATELGPRHQHHQQQHHNQ